MGNTFRHIITESKTLDDYKVEVYKWLKKKRKIKATYNEDADQYQNPDESIKYNDDIIVNLYLTYWDQPVYDLEWR